MREHRCIIEDDFDAIVMKLNAAGYFGIAW
jgi:hypothetical protein